MSKREPRSPYQKYGKSPFMYSPTYQLWKAAVLSGGAGSKKAFDLACHHAKTLGVFREDCHASG